MIREEFIPSEHTRYEDSQQHPLANGPHLVKIMVGKPQRRREELEGGRRGEVDEQETGQEKHGVGVLTQWDDRGLVGGH